MSVVGRYDRYAFYVKFQTKKPIRLPCAPLAFFSVIRLLLTLLVTLTNDA